MKNHPLTLIRAARGIVLGAVTMLPLAMSIGCSSGDPNDVLKGEVGVMSTGSGSAAGGRNNTSDHDGVGSTSSALTGDDTSAPVAAARYHGCSKITYAALGSILKSRGCSATGTTNALTLYNKGSASLGVANYSGRVPEAIIASTSAIAKQFDIFVAAAPEIQANVGQAAACQGVTLAQNGQFTKDGISCLTGKLATDEHVAVANQAVADAVKNGSAQNVTQDQGIQIAIAAMMEAAHTCE